MRRSLQFGIGTVQNVSWAEMVNRWKSIEDFGFDSVWVADQFCICSQPSASWFDGWTVLAGLATQTSHIRIGTCVTAIPWHHPAFLVRKALTLDHLSQGRLTLGIGTGLPGDCAHKIQVSKIGLLKKELRDLESMQRSWTCSCIMKLRPIMDDTIN